MIQVGVDLASEPLVTEIYFGRKINSEIHCALQSCSLWLLPTHLFSFLVIGASLSEPQTSGIALQDACVCQFAYARMCGHNYTFVFVE